MITALSVNLIYEPMINRADNKIYMCSTTQAVLQLHQFTDEEEASNYEYIEGDFFNTLYTVHLDSYQKLPMKFIPFDTTNFNTNHIHKDNKIVEFNDIVLKPDVLSAVAEISPGWFSMRYLFRFTRTCVRDIYIIPIDDIKLAIKTTTAKPNTSVKKHVEAQFGALNQSIKCKLDYCILSSQLFWLDKNNSLRPITRRQMHQPCTLINLTAAAIAKQLIESTINLTAEDIAKQIAAIATNPIAKAMEQQCIESTYIRDYESSLSIRLRQEKYSRKQFRISNVYKLPIPKKLQDLVKDHTIWYDAKMSILHPDVPNYDRLEMLEEEELVQILEITSNA